MVVLPGEPVIPHDVLIGFDLCYQTMVHQHIQHLVYRAGGNGRICFSDVFYDIVRCGMTLQLVDGLKNGDPLGRYLEAPAFQLIANLVDHQHKIE